MAIVSMSSLELYYAVREPHHIDVSYFIMWASKALQIVARIALFVPRPPKPLTLTQRGRHGHQADTKRWCSLKISPFVWM